MICGIMKDDGTMARLDDLVGFAQLHNLKIGTIGDLIAYRRRHDHLVEQRAEATFTSEWGGEWRALTFWNKATGSEQVALVKGKIDPNKPTLVRMHALSPFADVFGEGGPRGGLLRKSMEIIGKEGAGVIVVINRPRPDGYTVALQTRSGAIPPKDMDELRDYGVGATILTELGVHLLLLSARETHVHPAEDREHDRGEQRGPLQEEAQHDQQEPNVLWVPHAGVRPARCELAAPLCLIEDAPGPGEQYESAGDQRVGGDVEGTEMRIGLPAEQHLQEVPGVM